jgi:peptidoglycan hydrolase-like protein with peptidoglycan-binding domain
LSGLPWLRSAMTLEGRILRHSNGRLWALALVMSLSTLPASVLAAKAAAKPAPKPITKTEIRQAEERLTALGYWAGPADGVWDEASRQALVAFQKLEGARATGRLSRAEINALSVAEPPRPRYPEGPWGKGAGHLEVDLGRQVLFLVDAAGKVGNALPISSGSGKRFREAGYPETQAVTPCGRLEIYRKVDGWRTSPLGVMHNPLYIVGGIAIHGSPDVPTYPASHGCIRIPMFASHRLHRMVVVGTPVAIYGCAGEASALVAGEGGRSPG